MKFLTELFAWWTGNTIGTRLFTWRFGTRVGEDGFGNVYFQTKDGKRRWVVYRDLSEASLVPPEWHGWLHYTVDVPPTEETYHAAALAEGLCAEPHRQPGGLPAARQHPQSRCRQDAPAGLRTVAAGASEMSTVEMTPPKPVQRWQADDYAVKGRFVSELARPVVDLLAPRKGERILDLGCGDGVLTEAIAAYGADVLGADLSEELLAAAAAKGLKVQKVDGHALPFDRRVRCGLHQRCAPLDAPAASS